MGRADRDGTQPGGAEARLTELKPSGASRPPPLGLSLFPGCSCWEGTGLSHKAVANGLGQVQVRWHHATFPVAMTTDIAASPAPPRREDSRAQQLCSWWEQVVGHALATREGFLEEAGRGSSRQGSRGHHSLASPSAAPQAPLQRGTASSQAGRRAGWAAASGLGFVTAVAMTSLGSFGEAPSLFPASWTGGECPGRKFQDQSPSASEGRASARGRAVTSWDKY